MLDRSEPKNSTVKHLEFHGMIRNFWSGNPKRFVSFARFLDAPVIFHKCQQSALTFHITGSSWTVLAAE